MAGVEEEWSPPGSPFCADSYFGICSTPIKIIFKNTTLILKGHQNGTNTSTSTNSPYHDLSDSLSVKIQSSIYYHNAKCTGKITVLVLVP